MTAAAAPPVPADLLTTIARFTVLAGALSVVVPYFVGLTATLGALAFVAWAVVRRSAPSASKGWPDWMIGGTAAAVGWSVALGVPGTWFAVRGPILAGMTVVLWNLARRARARGSRR
ncbi:MAG: hypothetical protein L3K23_08510 [Thermoplasmata archaeon]|nr:hypothetical protein [Thermoplasmata archaeon]